MTRIGRRFGRERALLSLAVGAARGLNLRLARVESLHEEDGDAEAGGDDE